jgi:hypothetical protein
MERSNDKEFVGIVECIQDESTFYYCLKNAVNGGMEGSSGLDTIAEAVASSLGDGFRQRITYTPPEDIDYGDGHLCPRRYHKLSVLERDRFEKKVLEELQAIKKSQRKEK